MKLLLLQNLFFRKVNQKTTTLFSIKRFVKLVYKTTSYCFVSFCVFSTVFNNFGYPACVQGVSMRPHLNEYSIYPSLFWLKLDQDWVFVNCWKARNHEFERGDVVIFVSPRDPADFVIKRLIAVEGDVVFSERFKTDSPVTIKQGYCWVEGDNAANSIDSNKYGPIPKGLIFGKATRVIWPPQRIRRLKPELISTPERSIENLSNGNKIIKTGKIRKNTKKRFESYDEDLQLF